MTLSLPPEYVIQQYKASAEEFDAKARSARLTDNEAQALDYEAAAMTARKKADELEQVDGLQ